MRRRFSERGTGQELSSDHRERENMRAAAGSKSMGGSRSRSRRRRRRRREQVVDSGLLLWYLRVLSSRSGAVGTRLEGKGRIKRT
ncbi:uncharacterized protein BDV14DRAFT_21367 [Aspergillus stella-maris]|uniref:uncharacterized protein n=1 Tax=Aspergillus stella-maris TaxID=1810926 RepID=UPI003CCDAA05